MARETKAQKAAREQAEADQAARKLSDFEGRQVIGAAVEMPNAAGGLREAMKFEPVEIHHGDEGYMVLHWKAKKVRFDPVKDTNALTRVVVLDVDEAALAEDELIEDLLARQRERLAVAREAEEAEERLRTGELSLDDAAKNAEHDDGQHANGFRRGCPKCAAEIDALRDEGVDDIVYVDDTDGEGS